MIYYFIAADLALVMKMETRNKSKNILRLDLQKSIDVIDSSHEVSIKSISHRYDIFIKKIKIAFEKDMAAIVYNAKNNAD